MAYTKVEKPESTSLVDYPRITQEIVDQQRKNLAEWVAELRSGKYGQAKDYLREGDKYCCLGVLCNMVNPEGWTKDGMGTSQAYRFQDGGLLTPGPNSAFSFGLRNSRGAFITTEEILKQFPKIALVPAVASAAPFGTLVGRVVGLTDLNDFGFSFQEIADVIEAKPKDLLYEVGNRYCP